VEEQAVVALVSSYGTNPSGSFKKLSKQQVEYLILTTSQPYLQAELCLAWLTLCPERRKIWGSAAAKAQQARDVFREQWEQFKDGRSDAYRCAVSLIFIFINDLKVNYQSGFEKIRSLQTVFSSCEKM
jgi:hypothetical protein